MGFINDDMSKPEKRKHTRKAKGKAYTTKWTKRPQQINRQNIHKRKDKPSDQLISYLRDGLVKITQVGLGDLSK